MTWKTPTTQPVLAPNRVHVWRVDQRNLWSQESALRQILSEDEKTRADRFVFVSDRSNFIAARWALRTLLGRYLNEEPLGLPIEESAFGKPFVSKSLQNKHLKFNLSHSHGVCVVVFALEKEVGVDVEHIRSDVAFDDLAARYFSRQENDALQQLDSARRELAFWSIWTRKEAYVKARGEGLQIPLDSFAVSVSPNEESPALHSSDQDRWTIRSFPMQGAYLGACVAESPVEGLDFWDFIVKG
jgi:4'-phosphopantetheinyl transferase